MLNRVKCQTVKALVAAGIVGRAAGDMPGTDTTYHLTQRGLGLLPVIQGLVRFGFAALLPADEDEGPVTFDQTWAAPDPDAVADETYQWSVDGVEFGLSVSDDTIYRALKKLGFSHVSARPKAYRQNAEAMDAFKKTSPSVWRKSVRSSHPRQR